MQLPIESSSTMARAIGTWKVFSMARKANGQGHTYKVGNSYRTVIHRDAYIVTAMARTPQESKRKAKEKLLTLPNLSPADEVPVNPKMKLGEFLLDWLEKTHQNNIAHTTYKRYRSLAVQHINPSLGDYELRKVTPRLITWLLATMREGGQSVRSQQQARALLSIALAEAENLNLIMVNPVRKVKNPQGSTRVISPLKIEEVKRLLKTYEGTYLSARLHIAMVCGLRQGEALGLRWQDIDFEAGTLRVQAQMQLVNNEPIFTRLKTDRSYRTLVLTQESLQSLTQHKQIIDSWALRSDSNWQGLDLVFPQNDGSARSPKTDYAEWQKALKLCGITPKRLHDARHTAATLMYSQGVGIETISRALGHSSSAITSRLYVHSAEEPLRKAAKLMSEALNI
jgi:integrase